jgi:hypothetical protein
VERLRASLLPGYELVIEGKERVYYGTAKEEIAWIRTAETFVR